MTKNLTFCHQGSFGDTIYSLIAIKLMGGGDFYVKLHGMNELSWNAFGQVTAGIHAGRYTKEDIDFLFPLLEKQSYIKKLALWRNEHIDYDLGTHYKWTVPTGWHGNQTECYGLVCGIDIKKYRKELVLDPWLDPVEPIKIPGRPFVINRTDRYLGTPDKNNDTWKEWVDQGLSDYAVFVGTEQECEDFNRQFDCRIPYQKVEDMLELARIIQGCEQFMGNQSMPLSVAIGLGKTFCCEIRKDFDHYRTPTGELGDVWFPRINGHYF